MPRVLVTGATGFVGRALVARLASDGCWSIRSAVRRDGHPPPTGVEQCHVPDVGPETAWGRALEGVDAVIHLAARVHVMREQRSDPLTAFREVNVAGTLNLASQAAAAGAKRLLFMSSVKVNGESGRFTEADTPHPADAYGTSKHEAEVGLGEIASTVGLEVVFIRPPLVYGPGVKANFRALMNAVRRGLPLPLGAIHNRRSLIALDNLVDFLVTCLVHPAAAGETFLVRDSEDLSTTELLRRLACAMHQRVRLVPVPAWLLMAGAIALGQRDVARRLLGSLQVDDSKARRVLRWSPPISVEEGLSRAVVAG